MCSFLCCTEEVCINVKNMSACWSDQPCKQVLNNINFSMVRFQTIILCHCVSWSMLIGMWSYECGGISRSWKGRSYIGMLMEGAVEFLFEGSQILRTCF